MKRTLAEARAVLDSCVIHPSDIEGQQLLEQQLASNRSLTDLVEKMEAVFSEVAVLAI